MRAGGAIAVWGFACAWIAFANSIPPPIVAIAGSSSIRICRPLMVQNLEENCAINLPISGD
jgi:hypothetical protein